MKYLETDGEGGFKWSEDGGGGEIPEPPHNFTFIPRSPFYLSSILWEKPEKQTVDFYEIECKLSDGFPVMSPWSAEITSILLKDDNLYSLGILSIDGEYTLRIRLVSLGIASEYSNPVKIVIGI